jgi:acid phosphatase type 7
VIGAAGDIACDPGEDGFEGGAGTRANCRAQAVSDLLVRARAAGTLAAVLPLGDLQYECGRAEAFAASYERSWGRLKAISHPVLGNHEYGRPCHLDDPAPYFDYFGAAAGAPGKGWYSYDIGSWHLIALNSECSYGSGASAVAGCDAGSPQEAWLRADLAAHASACTLAYWHEPRFSSGQHGDAQAMATVWNDLVAAHADVVLSGHNHDYERFQPLGATAPAPASPASTTTGTPSFQDPVLDPNGIREFVVGTGGKSADPFERRPLAGEEVRSDDTYGVLLLTLLPAGYDWRFISERGKTLIDSGSGSCH